MVLKQTSEYSLDTDGNKVFKPLFVAITYDAHIVTFEITDDNQINIINDFKDLTTQLRYVRQCAIQKDVICFISETGHLDAGGKKKNADKIDQNMLVICQVRNNRLKVLRIMKGNFELMEIKAADDKSIESPLIFAVQKNIEDD